MTQDELDAVLEEAVQVAHLEVLAISKLPWDANARGRASAAIYIRQNLENLKSKPGESSPEAADPKAMPPEEAALLSEMLRQKERADAAEASASTWKEEADAYQMRWRDMVAERDALKARLDALSLNLQIEVDRRAELQVAYASLKARLDKAEADAKAAMERVERLTWEANGAKMGGET